MKNNQNNKPANLGKYVLTENGNYMICKDNFFFFMTAAGIHLDGYEKKTGKLHSTQKWAELKNGSEQGDQPLTADLAKKAATIIKMKLKPLQMKIQREKEKDVKAAKRNARAKPATYKAFQNLKEVKLSFTHGGKNKAA